MGMDGILGGGSRVATEGLLAVSPADAARLTGVGRTKLYEAIGSGALRSLKIGKRRLIMIEALRDWLAAAEREATDAR
jgi:excisionase family DNA binding protein